MQSAQLSHPTSTSASLLTTCSSITTASRSHKRQNRNTSLSNSPLACIPVQFPPLPPTYSPLLFPTQPIFNLTSRRHRKEPLATTLQKVQSYIHLPSPPSHPLGGPTVPRNRRISLSTPHLLSPHLPERKTHEIKSIASGSSSIHLSYLYLWG